MIDRRGQGSTLLEVLVVMVIGAILAGLVILRVGDWRAPEDPQRQLERLAALIEAQCEQALFQARPRGVRFTVDGYDFWQATAEGWLPLADKGISRTRQWQGVASIELDLAGHRVRLDEASQAPHVVCQPLGELTAFTLEFGAENRQLRLIGQGSGDMTLDRIL